MTPVLTALREGRLEYTKGQAIARVKEEAPRQALLAEAIAQALPLSEIKARVKQLQVEPEPTPHKVVAQRLGEIGKRLQKSQVLSDRKKRDRVMKLLDELDKMTSL